MSHRRGPRSLSILLAFFDGFSGNVRKFLWRNDSGIPSGNSSEASEAGTVYDFDTIDVDGKPELAFKCLKKLVGERGFEPPTPLSRTRFNQLLKCVEICRSHLIDIELVMCWRWSSIDLG